MMTRDQKQVKLGDFGVARILDTNEQGETLKATTVTGTPTHMAPEVWEKSGYTAAMDIWSLGVCLYQLCNLHLPFEGTGQNEIMEKVKAGVYPEVKMHNSKKLKELIAMCLSVDPSLRPNIDTLIDLVTEIDFNLPTATTTM